MVGRNAAGSLIAGSEVIRLHSLGRLHVSLGIVFQCVVRRCAALLRALGLRSKGADVSRRITSGRLLITGHRAPGPILITLKALTVGLITSLHRNIVARRRFCGVRLVVTVVVIWGSILRR